MANDLADKRKLKPKVYRVGKEEQTNCSNNISWNDRSFQNKGTYQVFGAQNTMNKKMTYYIKAHQHEISQHHGLRKDSQSTFSLGGWGGGGGGKGGQAKRIRSQNGTELLKRNAGSYVTM